MVRFDDNSKIKSSETFGIDGSLVDVTIIKSRSNKAGKFVTLLFDQDNGFDEELSLLLLLKDHNKIKGAGAYLYIEGYDEVKFSQKQFKTKLKENEGLKQVFIREVLSILQTSLDERYKEVDELMASSSVTDDIISAMRAA